jgi:ATP-dependent DNA helicase RecG
MGIPHKGPDLLGQILQAARVGESTDWEFKSARGGFPGSFWETYSAMANAEGGVVVLGVRETDAGAVLDGLTPEQIARYQKVLWDGLNNRGQVNLNLLEPRHVEAIEVEGGRLLAIRIPRATRAQRPVHLGGNPLGGTYRRRYEGDYRCSDAETRRMLADADETPRDHRILSGFGLDDLDPASLTQYRQRLRAAKPDHPWLDLKDLDFLERLGGWRRDRATGTEGLTLAGLLMFGKDLSIRDADGAPGYFVDYREKLDPELRWTDRLYPDGTWEPNLFQFYARIWPKLASGLPTPFRLEGVERRDVTPAHESLREAVVNALIHADYAGAGGIVIERYPDRFVVENPGTLLVSMEQYLIGGVSECRNRALQQMFLMIGGGERAGSGADKIRSGWRAQHWRVPNLELREDPDRIRLTMPMVSLIPPETHEHLRSLFGAQVDQLTAAELQGLATASLERSVSNTRLQQLLADHPTAITRMLAGLCERGLLVSDNRRRWTTYRLGTAKPTQDSLPFVEDSPHKGGETPHIGTGDSSHKGGGVATQEGGTPHIREGDSSHKPGDSSHSTEGVSHVLGAIPLSAKAERVAKTARISPKLVQEAILELCLGQYVTTDQLAKALNRNAHGLRSRYLSSMTEQGLLQLRYPESPNRPDQAYTTAKGTP